MTVGDSKQLSITRTDLSDDELVTWVSSDPDVASVDDEGLLTAIEAGTATITAYCGTAEASIKVTVKAKGGTTMITNVKAVAPDEDLYDLRGINVTTPTRSQIYIRRKK